MPKVIGAARVTTKDGAVWRNCAACDVLSPLPPDVAHCPACTPISGVGLSRNQIDGYACVVCGASDTPMVPAGRLPGWGQVFACATHEPGWSW